MEEKPCQNGLYRRRSITENRKQHESFSYAPSLLVAVLLALRQRHWLGELIRHSAGLRTFILASLIQAVWPILNLLFMNAEVLRFPILSAFADQCSSSAVRQFSLAQKSD